MKSRRKFLCHAAYVSTALLGIPSVFAAAVTHGTPKLLQLRSPASLHYSSFARLLGSSFWVPDFPQHGQWLALANSTLDQSQKALECFSLVFQGSGNCSMPQGTFSFYHPKLGMFPLFIVPQPSPSGSCLYEAVFNRLI